MYFLYVQERFDMTPDIFVSNIGGIFGLFLGASFLTVVEAVVNGFHYIMKLCRNCTTRSGGVSLEHLEL